MEKLVDDELEALGLLASDKKAPPVQAGEFLGLAYDTVKGASILLLEKAASLAKAALDRRGHSSAGLGSLRLGGCLEHVPSCTVTRGHPPAHSL